MVKGTMGFALLIAAAAAGSACAMTTSSSERMSCSVEGAEKLPRALGGQSGICSVIEKALAPAIAGGGIPYSAVSVKVEVKSDSRISAVASVSGKLLPEQNVATSDRALNAAALQMLANALAAEVTKL